MGIEDLSEYNWLAKLPEMKKNYLYNIREKIKPILETNLIPNFTDHSIKHSDRLVRIIGALLHDDKTDKPVLIDAEVLILISAAILHDVSLFIPSAHGFDKPINEITWDEWTTIRKQHGEISGLIIRKIASGQDAYKLNIYNDLHIKFLPAIATLCEYHQSSTNYDPDEKISLDGKILRIGLLISLLRLSDQLDCDSNRVQMDNLARYAIPCDSILHWIACHYVDSVLIENGAIFIFVSYPSTATGPIIDRMANDLIIKIKEEYDKSNDVFWRNNIRIRIPTCVSYSNEKFSYIKREIPEDCLKLLETRLTSDSPKFVSLISEPTKEKSQKKVTLDYMTYWKFIGNPFLDQPVAYGDNVFIDTPSISRMVNEIERHLEGPTGDLRLVIGERGMGKTSLFETLERKLGSKYSINIIDVANHISSVRNAVELHQLIIGSIGKQIRPDDSDINPGEILNSANIGRRKVICIDSLDRLPADKTDILIEFFKTAQKFFTDLRGRSVILISCAPEWGKFLSGKDLSYLGIKNIWHLEPFETSEISNMLDKRIVSSGRQYLEVFDQSSAAAIYTLSSGNPRSVLDHAEAICRFAASRDFHPISGKFIRECYEKEFDESLASLIRELSLTSTNAKKGLNMLYLFYLEMERRCLLLSEGWRYLGELLSNGLLKERLPPAFKGPISNVGNLSNIMKEGSLIPIYKPNQEVQDLFKALKMKGYQKEDFMAYYSANPIRPSEDDDQSLFELKSGMQVGDDFIHFEKAHNLYFKLSKNNRKAPFQIIISSWDCLEEIVIGILVKYHNMNADKYYDKKQTAYYLDRYGVPRRSRNSGHVLAESAQELVTEFKIFLRDNNQFMSSFTSLRWVLETRNNIEKAGTSHLLNYGERESEICLKNVELAYRELLRISNFR
jgi:hypothetical protein